MNDDYVMLDESINWYIFLVVWSLCNVDRLVAVVKLLDLLF
jgi:hypothetical protein